MGFDALSYADGFLRRASTGTQFRTSDKWDADILPESSVSTASSGQHKPPTSASRPPPSRRVHAVSPHHEEKEEVSVHSPSSSSESECCDAEDRSCCSCGSDESHLCRAGLDAVAVSPIATRRDGYGAHQLTHRSSAAAQSFSSHTGTTTVTTTTQFVPGPSYVVAHAAVPQPHTVAVPVIHPTHSRPNHSLSSPGKPERLPQPRTYVRPSYDSSPPSDISTPSPLWRREYGYGDESGYSSDSSTASIWEDDYQLYGSHGRDRIAHQTHSSYRYTSMHDSHAARHFK
jgi:hypothetical protein